MDISKGQEGDSCLSHRHCPCGCPGQAQGQSLPVGVSRQSLGTRMVDNVRP